MKKLLFIMFFTILTIGVFAQDLTGVTNDGRQVLLKPDGTWQFIEQQEFELSIIDFEISKRNKDTSAGRYSNDATLSLLIKNETDKNIIGWRINLEISNAFGDSLHTVQLTSGDSDLLSGEKQESLFRWDNNQFIDDEIYDTLALYSKSMLLLLIKSVMVVYSE